MPAALAAVAGSFGAAALLLVFLWGATGWACDVGAALHVALPFDSGHAHNSEQHAGLEGSLAQGAIDLHIAAACINFKLVRFAVRGFLDALWSRSTATATLAQIRRSNEAPALHSDMAFSCRHCQIVHCQHHGKP